MASYLFVDAGSLFTLAQAGLLDTLLQQNNGGRQLVITQEVYEEIQSTGQTSLNALAWISANRNKLTLIDDVILPNYITKDRGEQSISRYMLGATSLDGFRVTDAFTTADVLVIGENPNDINDLIKFSLNFVSPSPETTTGITVTVH